MTLEEIKRRVESRLYIPADELLRLIAEHERYRAALDVKDEVLRDIDKWVLGEIVGKCPMCDPDVGHTCPHCTAKYEWIPNALKAAR